jgi:putative ABC transport system substrate-binding protein
MKIATGQQASGENQRFQFAACVLCALLVAMASPADAQPLKRVFRVGYLSPYAELEPRAQGFRQGLKELRYVEGQNLAVEWRFANTQSDLLTKFAAELASLPADVIVAPTTPVIQAVKKATATIPIVMVAAADPVEGGLVRSLARPAGNITGITSISADLYGKRFELLKEVVPRLSRVGVLRQPNFTPRSPRSFKEVEAIAGTLGLRLQSLEVRVPEDLEDVLRAALKEESQAHSFSIIRSSSLEGSASRI